jgi:hypothetical protein
LFYFLALGQELCYTKIISEKKKRENALKILDFFKFSIKILGKLCIVGLCGQMRQRRREERERG